MAEQKNAGDANAFIAEYGPIAATIGKKLKVDPGVILAQFGLETGWGASVVPGTYNLGNIKSAGKGVQAVDNVTKTKDSYLKFEDPEVFADYYADYMQRQYPKVVGTGSNVDAFSKALHYGQPGGYAQDPDYGPKLGDAFALVSNRIEAGGENPFGAGATEADAIAAEPAPTPVAGADAPAATFTGGPDGALAGAVAGFGAGVVAKHTRTPSSAKYNTAMEQLRTAEDKLAQARAGNAQGSSLQDLETELQSRKTVAAQAADELRVAEAELKSSTRAASAPVTPPGAPGRTVPGASGASNWVRAMSDDVPDVLAQSAENMRGDNPRGGQAIINRDTAAKTRIQNMGAGNFQLSGQGASQLMLPPGLAAERTAAMEAELATKQAQDAADRARATQAADVAQTRVDQARDARRAAGTLVGEQGQLVRDASQAQKVTNRAQMGVDAAKARVARTPAGPKGALQTMGAFTAKAAPRALGVLSGAATGMAAMTAIERFKAGDYSGAVLPTLEATFGVMSMLPPAHPVLLALRGIGTVGGAALAGYEGYKAVSE